MRASGMRPAGARIVVFSPAPGVFFMEAVWISTGLVALAEIGDKTQLLAIVLAARFRRPLPIILGILAATIANHAAAAGAGYLIAQWLTGQTFQIAIKGIGAFTFDAAIRGRAGVERAVHAERATATRVAAARSTTMNQAGAAESTKERREDSSPALFAEEQGQAGRRQPEERRHQDDVQPARLAVESRDVLIGADSVIE